MLLEWEKEQSCLLQVSLLRGGQKPAFSVPSQHCPGGKRRAKLLPLKSRRAKNEGLRDVPTADKGAEERGGSEELAPKLPAGLPWILC